MKYEGMIMWLERHRDELLIQENEPMADVIGDAISIIKLHSPKKPKVVRTPKRWNGAVTVCPICGTLIWHGDMMCRNCTQVINWGDEERGYRE